MERTMVEFNEDKQLKRFAELKKKEEEDLANTLSSKYGIGYLDLSVMPINIDALRVVHEADAREAQLAVFNVVDKKIDVAVLSPQNEKTLTKIEDLKQEGYIPRLFMVSHASLEKVWDRYKDLSYSFETKSGALDISNDEIVDMLKKSRHFLKLKSRSKQCSHSKKVSVFQKYLKSLLPVRSLQKHPIFT
jgi:hypothetical protein